VNKSFNKELTKSPVHFYMKRIFQDQTPEYEHQAAYNPTNQTGVYDHFFLAADQLF
jgi:hypothetical protein